MIVDTSVFISFYHETDVNHKKAIEVLGNNQNRILISDYILNEVISVSLRKMGLERAKYILEIIIDQELVSVKHTSESEFYEILEIFKNQNDKLSFVDCSIILLAKIHGQNVVSFDKNLVDYIKQNK